MEPEGSLPYQKSPPPAHILSQINPVHEPSIALLEDPF